MLKYKDEKVVEFHFLRYSVIWVMGTPAGKEILEVGVVATVSYYPGSLGFYCALLFNWVNKLK